MSAVDIIDGRGYILNVEFGGGKDGVDGKDGRDGVAPDLQIGTVKESEDDQPHVTISDEGDGKLSLNFDLVSGQDGQNGEDGGVYIPSVSQEGVISWIAPTGQGPIPPVSVKGETGATFTPEVSLGGEISWTNDKGLENPDTRNIRGPKGEKGDPFTIYKVYNSKAEMDADYGNPDVPMGAFVCITNSVDQSENATLYVKGTQEYTFVTDLSGATGIQGTPGIGIGKVEFTGVETATYKEYGVYDDTDDENLLGTFNLPKGADGHQGTDGIGIRSIVQTTTSHEDDGVNIVTVTLTDGNTSTFNVENGSKGSTGAQGPAGQNGQDGQDGVGIDHISVEQSTFDGEPNRVTIHLTDESSETFNVYNGHTGATGTAGVLHTNNSTAITPGPGDESMSNDIRLHKISKTGNYNDLIDKPTIPAAANDSLITIQKNGATVNTFTLNQSSPKTVNIPVPTTVAELTDASSYAKKSDLATVATSGSYYDLDDIPTIGNGLLTIRSVRNTTPEGYDTIGEFSANATGPVFVNLSKVARTGKYGDLKDVPLLSPIYSNASLLTTIENWPEVYTLRMYRRAKFISTLEFSEDPFILLRFGDAINGVRYIPMPSNKTQIIEVTINASALDSARIFGYTSMVFYLYAVTGDDGNVEKCQLASIYNGNDEIYLNPHIIWCQDQAPSNNDFDKVIYTDYSNICTLSELELGDVVEGDDHAINVILVKDDNDSSIKRLCIGIRTNDNDFNGVEAVASLRVLNVFDNKYEDRETEELIAYEVVSFTGDGSSEHPYVPQYTPGEYYRRSNGNKFTLLNDTSAPSDWGASKTFYKYPVGN